MKILITGGASGLGEAVTKRLSKDERNTIFFTYFHSSENARALEKNYINVKGVYCDFSNEDSISNLINDIESMNLDILINNALTGFTKNHFHKLDYNVFLKSFESNVMPIIRITQKCLIEFRKRKFGKIINILTEALINNPRIGWSEYVANKAYIESLSKSWAVENNRFCITSNCISPSFLMTGLTSDTDERVIEQIMNEQPFGKLVTTEEVAEAVKYLIGCTQQINGINLIINGGKNMI